MVKIAFAFVALALTVLPAVSRAGDAADAALAASVEQAWMADKKDAAIR